MKEYDGILMAVAYKALVLLTQLPLLAGVHLEESLFWVSVTTRILVPDQLRVVHFPCENEGIGLTAFVFVKS